MNPNILNEELEKAIDEKIGEFIKANPNSVIDNGKVVSFEKIIEVHSEITEDYSSEETLAGKKINVNVRGNIAFMAKSDDPNGEFSYNFVITPASFTFDFTSKNFVIDNPQRIVFSIF